MRKLISVMYCGISIFSTLAGAAPGKIPCIVREVDPATDSLMTGEELKPGQIALTFDDGPYPVYTHAILGILEKYGVRATFFEVGEMAHAYPALAREVIDRGHTAGTHSYTHPELPTLSTTAAENEIRKGIQAVSEANGGRTSPFFRFPFLNQSPALAAFVQQSGLVSFRWNGLSLMTQLVSVPAALEGTAQDKRQGGILITHDIHQSAVDVLPMFLEQMLKKHYTAVVYVLKNTADPTPTPSPSLQP